ncbi:glycosyltransferase [Sulfitobacter sp. JB4-11]|uniref:glycosyltransferase n=1 Tax=Sulfitobacter rhodophyticola TaxID=3238304 RepID=UPI0035164D56
MHTDNIQALGITRWSYPCGQDGFRREGGDLVALRATLYAPHRLEHRIFLLEHVLLPCLRAQTDPDFTHLFVMGDGLPDPWRSRVLALLETVPQIRPVFWPEGQDMMEVCRTIIHDHIDPTCTAIAQYRLDDDDAVAIEFILRTRAVFAKMQSFFDESGRLGIDFCRGFIMQTSAAGIEINPVSMRFWAPGQMVFLRPDTNRTLFDFNHLQIWHHMPAMTWNEEPMFIRGAHHDNDSHLASFARRTKSFKFRHARPTRYFKRRFGFDLRLMRALWAERAAVFLDGSKDAPSQNAS